ncbi:MAG: ABC transporter permease [Chloroflexi bacterium]|nr:ABC transporter permease [Chloroflexota bacterium]MCL5275081.1 ABC transporter permease [Chloroflexota bacterium]
MEMTLVWVIARRELREALRRKWLWLFAVGFAVLALALSQAGLASAGYAGLGGFGRTAASMINVILLFAPLIGLSVGAGVLSGDRERGTLLYLMAQPVSRAEIFWGKALGAVLAVACALSLGFGLAALGLASARDGQASVYLALVGYTLLLAFASLGVGFMIGALSKKGATAMGTALLVWLALVFAGDLGIMGMTLALRPAPDVLLVTLLVNPLQVFKLGAILGLRSTLDTLGVAGQYAMYRFGQALPLLLAGLLCAWTVASFGAAFALFNRKGDV